MGYTIGSEVLIIGTIGISHLLVPGSKGVIQYFSDNSDSVGIQGYNIQGRQIYQVLSSKDIVPYFKPGDCVCLRKDSQFVGGYEDHVNPTNCVGTITRIDHGELSNPLDNSLLPFYVAWSNGAEENCYSFFDLEYADKTEVLVEETPIDISKLKPITEMANTAQKNAVLVATVGLLQTQTTVVPKDVKSKLIKEESEYRWTQKIVEAQMKVLCEAGVLTCKGSNYSLPGMTASKVVKTVKVVKTSKGGFKKAKSTSGITKPVTGKALKITKLKALELMKNNKGRFFTAVFCKKDGNVRTINCQFRKEQSQESLGYVMVNESSLLKTSPKHAIRQINMQTLKSLTIAGQKYLLNN